MLGQEARQRSAGGKTAGCAWRHSVGAVSLGYLGNTPTGVGKTSVCSLAGVGKGKHPHGCGEDGISFSKPAVHEETPPRVWGRQISHLSARREQLEAQNASLWNSFKGLEPYQAEGRTYLLTPAGQQIVNAGKVGQRDAWEVVRR